MLLPTTKEKILKLFFKNPLLEIHQRETSRLAKISPHSAHLYLKEFVKKGLLNQRAISNMTFYKVNPESEFLFKIFEFFEMEKRERFLSGNKKIARLLTEYTKTLLKLSLREIQMVILFGSVARGDWTRRSDIDILTVTGKKNLQREISQIFEAAEKEVGSLLKIAPVSSTTEKFVEGTRKKLEFYDELWRDRIVLYNELLFWQLKREAQLQNG